MDFSLNIERFLCSCHSMIESWSTMIKICNIFFHSSFLSFFLAFAIIIFLSVPLFYLLFLCLMWISWNFLFYSHLINFKQILNILIKKIFFMNLFLWIFFLKKSYKKFSLKKFKFLKIEFFMILLFLLKSYIFHKFFFLI